MKRFYSFFLLLMFSTPSLAIEAGGAAPSCEVKIKGANQALDLSAYKQTVLLLDFWATWCPPCKQSMPFLNALRNELRDRGFEIIAINVDEDSTAAQTFLQRYPVDYQVVFDPEGDCPGKYGVQAMPSSYFIDREGRVRHVHLGFRHSDKDEIRRLALQLLQE